MDIAKLESSKELFVEIYIRFNECHFLKTLFAFVREEKTALKNKVIYSSSCNPAHINASYSQPTTRHCRFPCSREAVGWRFIFTALYSRIGNRCNVRVSGGVRVCCLGESGCEAIFLHLSLYIYIVKGISIWTWHE